MPNKRSAPGMTVWIAQVVIDGADAGISVHVSRDGAAKVIRAVFKNAGLEVPDITRDGDDAGYSGATSSWDLYRAAINP
jgi:hypothetical protein